MDASMWLTGWSIRVDGAGVAHRVELPDLPGGTLSLGPLTGRSADKTLSRPRCEGTHACSSLHFAN